MLTIVLWLLAGLAIAFVIYSYYIEPQQLRLTRRVVPIARLPVELEGLRIVHLSDFHIKSPRRAFPQKMARRAVEMTIQLAPDLVCLTGDLGHASRFISLATERLRPLAEQHFVCVVMGNHDHDKLLETEIGALPEEHVDMEQWRSEAKAAGFNVLQNEHIIWPVRGRYVIIAGVGDPSCGWDDLARALTNGSAQSLPQGDLHLLLVHSPDLLDDPLTDWADLVLCGHTHGGQFCLPKWGTPWAPVWRDRRRAAGLFRIGQAICHVTRGVAAGIRARFLCWPEICELILQRGDAALPHLPRYPLNGQ